MASALNFQKILKIIKDEGSLDSKIQALTSFRRACLEDQQILKTLKNEEFCQLCNSVINTTTKDDDKLHIEACRTLDIVLPETKNRKFDFFQSILQINRKKRLKILVSLSILKDETMAVIANKSSIIDFLNNCIKSVQPKSMNWLLPENAEHVVLMKSVENRVLNESEEYEEKVVDKTLQLLCRLYSLSSLGLNIRQFDIMVMDKIIMLAYLGHRKQRAQALLVLQQTVKNELGIRIRSFHREIWDKYKETLQNVYCKRMTLLVNASDHDWAIQWEMSITFIGTDLHRGSGLVNSLLKVEELAFKSADPNRRQAFLSWKLLIDNFALDQRELATTRRIKLLCVPLNAKNSKTELMVLTKLEVWWHLIYKVYPSLFECIDTVLVPFLNLCFGPFGDKPLYVQKTDNNVSLGKKFLKTQSFGIDAFQQLLISNEDEMNVSSSIKNENLPNPVNNTIFENAYKVLIHCFGEIVVILGLMPNEDINKADICQFLWSNLIKRIEEYDKIKGLMYKEIMNVVMELIKHRYHKITFIRDFLLNVLKHLNVISFNVNFTENMLEDLIQTYLQVDNFSCFTNDHYGCIESLLWQLIKPRNLNRYYLQTMELMQVILKILEEAKKVDSNMVGVYSIWCILARIIKKYIEDSQNINEGTLIQPNFQTIESIITFPFISIFIEDHVQLTTMAEIWRDLYKQFDFQVELIVSVKPNEILEKISNAIIVHLKADKRSCDFAVHCIDGLLNTVNYDNLPNDKEIPAFVQLLKELTLQCFFSKSIGTEKILKALSSFILRVFSHSIEKTGIYLKIIEPVVKYMLEKVDDNSLEREISATWSTIVGLFKKLQNSLNYEFLSCYRQTIVLAMLHLNMDISSTAFSILDMKDSVDDKSKMVLENIMNELEETSVKNNFDIVEIQEKSKKAKNTRIKQVGSFLNKKTTSPSNSASIVQNGKENAQKMKVVNIEPNSQDFVLINTDVKLDVERLTEHQKEMLKKRRDDIPAMYNELTISNSQDSQELQHWFDTKAVKSPTHSTNQTSNNNEIMNAAPTTLHQKTTAQNLTTELEKIIKTSSTVTSSKAQPKKSEDDAHNLVIDNSQPKNELETAPVVPTVAKKLNFESHEEFPDDQGERVSPSIIDKIRRKNLSEEADETEMAQEKGIRSTRRSLQPYQITLRKFNSTEQLNKRGKKRRNSESNSETMLSIEREKRPRHPDALEALSNVKINDNNKEVSGKKISKRQKNEMSRLKIDMRFEALPSRRSIVKTNETPANDKKTVPSKDDKSKEDKSEINSQQNSMIKKQHKRAIKTNVAKINDDELADVKKEKLASDSMDTNDKMIRKILLGKTEPVVSFFKRGNSLNDTQEEIDVKDISALLSYSQQIEDSGATDGYQNTKDKIDEPPSIDFKSSQDSDIVESSQEPTLNSKLDKVECFIKIKKVELSEVGINSDDELEKEKKIPETPVELNETSVIPETLDPDKVIYIQLDQKKSESSNADKAPVPLIHSSSPKNTSSRTFRSKGFPLQGRAAQMLGLVTKQSIAEKLAADPCKMETALNEEVTIIPVPKRDKIQKDCERLSSQSTGGLRQEKMFNNMNSSLRQEMCSSPCITMFCNLRNDGERISLRMDKQDFDQEAAKKEKETSQNGNIGDESPNGNSRRELPLLEWSNANPPSLTASPSASILKRMPEISIETPSRKKRVSFADPPVSREMGYEIMTESSSPPKLEKLPSSRSPISRKESKKHAKLRLIQITDSEKLEKENEVFRINSTEEKLSGINNRINDDICQNSNNLELAEPKARQATVVCNVSPSEAKVTEIDNNLPHLPAEEDIFVDNNNLPSNDENIDTIKTSTQNDQDNSSIKLESINLSNILHKSDNHQSSLEDTVDVENISSSLDSIPNLSDKPTGSSSQQSGEQGDTLPVTDSIFSNLPLTQETQNSIAQLNEPENLDSTLPVYPSLISCIEAVENISAELVDPLFTSHLAKHLSIRSIRSVGDLAQLTERDINRLPIRSPKISSVKKALSRYQEKLLEKTPEKRTTNVVPSSTPLGNKRKDKIRDDNDSLEDLMKNSDNNSDLGSINVSAVYDCKRAVKRLSIDSSMQTSPSKRSKKNDEEVCTEMMDQCDEAFLFNAFIKRFDAEKILNGYKEKMIHKSNRELKKDTLNMLGLSIEDDSEDSFKMSTKNVGLQKVLQELPKIFNAEDEFFDTLLNSYKRKLKAANVLDVLKPNDVKDAIMNKFNKTELLHMLIKRLEIDGNEKIPDTSDVAVLLDKISVKSIVDQVKTNKELRSSETLINIILKNIGETLSGNTKEVLFNTLTKNLDVCELADMYNETIKIKVRKIQEK